MPPASEKSSMHEDLVHHTRRRFQTYMNMSIRHFFTHNYEAVNVALSGALRDITMLRVEYTSVANSAMVEGFSNRPACRYTPISENHSERIFWCSSFHPPHRRVANVGATAHLSLLTLLFASGLQGTRPCASQNKL